MVPLRAISNAASLLLTYSSSSLISPMYSPWIGSESSQPSPSWEAHRMLW